MTRLLTYAAALAGVALMVYAIALVWLPAAVFTAGFALVVAALLIDPEPRKVRR